MRRPQTELEKAAYDWRSGYNPPRSADEINDLLDQFLEEMAYIGRMREELEELRAEVADLQ